jgi:ABC-2 type transport system ATP-binding protein
MSGVLRERAAAGVPVVFSSHQLDLVERLCDRVGIIKDGSMVAVGGIDELRTVGRPRWLVVGPPLGAGGGWIAGVPGVRVVGTDGPRTVVEVDEGVDAGDPVVQAVLRAALDAGPVREFSPVRPSLVELYRDVVSTPTEETAA